MRGVGMPEMKMTGMKISSRPEVKHPILSDIQSFEVPAFEQPIHFGKDEKKKKTPLITNGFSTALLALFMIAPISCQRITQSPQVAISHTTTVEPATDVAGQIDEKGFRVLLSSPHPKIQAMALKKLGENKQMSDTQKLVLLRGVIQELAAKSNQAPAVPGRPGPQVGDAVNPGPGTNPNEMMDMMMGQSMIIPALGESIGALREDSDKVSLLKYDIHPKGLSGEMQSGLPPILRSFSQKTYTDPALQRELRDWVRSLSKDEKPQIRALASQILSFTSEVPAPMKSGRLLLSDRTYNLGIAKALLKDSDGNVRQSAAMALAQMMGTAEFPEAEKAPLIRETLLANLSKENSAMVIPFFQAVGTLQNDTTKGELVREAMSPSQFQANIQTVEHFCQLLGTYAKENTGLRNQLMNDLRAGKDGTTKFVGNISFVLFPDHPQFKEVMTSLVHHKNPQIIKIAATFIPQITDVEARKGLVRDLVAYRQDELKPFMETVKRTNKIHQEIEAILDPEPGKPAPKIPEAEREALLKKLDAAMGERDVAQTQIDLINEVVMKGVLALPSFKDQDTAFQTEMVEKMMQHPEGRVRLFVAKIIPQLKSDEKKAALIRQAVDIEYNARFYERDPEAEPGEIPLIAPEGQTPYESIAVSAANAVGAIESDAVKIPLMLELSKHPLHHIRISLINSVPTIKSGHEQLKPALLELSRTSYKAVRDGFQEVMKRYPAEHLHAFIQDLSKADLDQKEDNDVTRGWHSRQIGAALVPLLPNEYDAQKLALLKTFAEDRLPQVRAIAGQSGIPLSGNDERNQLISFYSMSVDPYFIGIGLNALDKSTLPADAKEALVQRNADHKEPYVRAQVANRIGLLSQNAKNQELIQKLAKDAHAGVRGSLGQGLLQGPPAAMAGRLTLLKQLASDSDKMTRQMLAEGLSKNNPNQDVLEIIRSLSQDKEPEVRIGVAGAAGRVSDPGERQTLLNSLLQGQTAMDQSKITWNFMNPPTP